MTKESKRDRFTRLAEARTNKIITGIKRLGNCSNRSTYEYTKDDVRKVFNAIKRELDKARASFGEDEQSNFRLK